jgi:hypothetical protein
MALPRLDPGIARLSTRFGASSVRNYTTEAENLRISSFLQQATNTGTCICCAAAWMAGTSQDKPGHDARG